MKRVFVFLLFTFLVFSCTKRESYVIKTRDFKELNVPFNLPVDQFLPLKELNSKSSYAFLYYGADGAVHYYKDGNDVILNKPILEKFKGGVFDGLSYKIEGNTLYVAQWVRYLGDPRTKKVILIRTDLDGKNPQYTLVSSTNESIGKPMIETDGKGSVLLVWSDESNGYGVAYAVSSDGGKTFPQETILRPANLAGNLDAYIPYFDTKNGFSVVYTTDKDIRVRRVKDSQEAVLFKFDEGYQYVPYVERGKGEFYIFAWRLPKTTRLMFTAHTNSPSWYTETPLTSLSQNWKRSTSAFIPTYNRQFLIARHHSFSP